ncbi:MAG: 5-bromo-4-chloroindolyl phosphate hydrolysis family protein [Xanthomonadales bacterium]|nr:5-bromo-4-chloroindolyl phosphate hydrolysis family protein [Xanthomonadales bacterium]
MNRPTQEEFVISGPRGLLLFLLPLPLVAVLLAALVQGELLRALLSGGSLAMFYTAGAWMRRGLQEETAFFERKYATEAPFPRKTLASLLVGAGTFVTAQFLAGIPLLETIGYSLGSVVGSLLVYGLDPRKPRSAGLDKTLAEALAVAEQQILEIELANSDIKCPELTERMDRITDKAREILDVLIHKPQAASEARRFLSSYLEGAERVTKGYAGTHRKAGSQELEDNFRKVLITIEDVFEEQHQRLMEDELTDLDVQIEVLKTQLKREGVS